MKERGKKGEEIAVQFLKKSGHRIVERNYVTRFGEIDIITKSPSGELCFVEVKSETLPMSGPFKINRNKIDKIKKSSFDFLSKRRWTKGMQVRFDFIWVNLEESKVIEYIEGGVE